MRIFAAYEEAGIGLPKEEVLTLALSVRNFTLKSSSTNIRFWGKIYGTNKNYYVIEAEETIQKDQPLKITTDLLDTDMKKEEEDLGTLDLDPLPKPDWKPPPTILPEESGKGLNKKVYYVCNLIGEPWIQLPDVTPAQITSSRVIRYLFTGDLEAEMDTYPPFPGVEKNYLRAQIARISGSTVISPINFYQFDEDEEEAVEEDAFRESFVENPEYEPVSIFELIDAGLANWVHHTAYILPQGRTIWWNPSSATRGEGASGRSEEEDEEEELEDEPEPETGPPLLTPLSEDAEVQGQPPWSTRITSHLIPLYAYAVLSSNLWPGAHAIASGRRTLLQKRR
ncbi:unnamed protein product [Calicophoron daubneyi]|uniref:Uncharacterized protein n=1 Tax=Calicophoron daubneyi TaxID=300641 RepID=A0AAV2TK25_CALDB